MRTPCFALLLALSLGFPASADEARLTILYTSDLHGSLTAYDYLADRPADRGLTKLASIVRAIRAEGVPTLLLDAGDAMQGGPLEAIYQQGSRALPEPMMSAMNQIGYDAMAVGNHEFGFGPTALAQARQTARFPWLAANVTRSNDGQPAFDRSVVKIVGGLRVGVVGICTPAVTWLEDSAHVAGFRFLPPVEAARQEVQRLRQSERCEVVVLLAHTGLEPPSASSGSSVASEVDENWGRRLAAEITGVDLVILGHTHAVLPSVQIGGSQVTQAGALGQHLGRADFTLRREAPSDSWKVASRRSRVLAVADTTVVDSSLAAFAEPYHRATQTALAAPLGTATRDLESTHGRFGDGPVWELVHRVQLEATGADVSLAALFDPEARVARGAVTLRDVMRIYPFDNTLGVVEMTGAELKQALEHSARYLSAYDYESNHPLADPDVPGFNFDSAEGIDYQIDLTRPVGQRVVGLSFRGAPLAPDRKLKVAVNSYRMRGGGGFEAIRQAPRLIQPDRDIRSLLVDHIRRVGTLNDSYAQNWSLLPEFVATSERPFIDLLVRQSVLTREEARTMRARAPARRSDLARWLSRAFGWKETQPAQKFRDVPDSLQARFNALLQRGVLGESSGGGAMRPTEPVRLPLALDWCERTARHEHYAIAARRDASFRAALLTGITDGRGPRPDTLTQAQALGVIANLRYPTIRVLETTDFHGAMISSARERNRPLGGSAVLAAHVERLRAQNPEGTVLLDGGDCFQGTMISNLQFGRPVVDQMNALRYSAMAVGNHEFDWSADTLARRVRAMRFAALGANMRERASGRMPAWVRSDTVVSRRGVRIGVLGLCFRYTPSVTLAKHVAHLRFEDDSATAARLVPKLRARADVVVGVGHIPASTDSSRRARSGDLVRLARGVKGVDAWFGGHSHNRVLDRVDGVPVMIAGSHGQVVGVCDLVVDPLRNRVVESRTELVLTYADAVKPDSAMTALVARWNSAVEAVASQPLGKNARRLARNRNGESVLGDFVTDAIRIAVGADIAFQNSGGLRADLPEGTVTKGTIYEVMPFDNLIITFDLTGAEVRQALEQGRGRVAQVSGIRYVFDPNLPEGKRILSVTDTEGRPLEETKRYRVACNDFMATGGDDYDVLSQGANRKETGILVRDVLEKLVIEKSRNGGALDYRPDGRIQRGGERRSGDGE